LFRSKTIEKEMGHHRVEGFGFAFPRQDVGVHEVDGSSRAGHVGLRQRQHASTGIDRRDVGAGVALAERRDEPATTNTQHQDAARSIAVFDEGRARSLQQRSGAHRFHPSIVRGQEIEAVGGVALAKPVTAPPGEGDQAADGVTRDVPRIAGGMREQVRTDRFEEDGPQHQVRRHLTPRWRTRVIAPSHVPMQ